MSVEDRANDVKIASKDFNELAKKVWFKYKEPPLMRPLGEKALMQFDDAVLKALKDIADDERRARHSLYEEVKIWANKLRDGERLYIIEETSKPAWDDNRGSVINYYYTSIRTYDRHDVVERQVAALMKDKEFWLYGPITKDMVSHLR